MPLVQVHSPQKTLPTQTDPMEPRRPKSLRELIRKGSGIFRAKCADNSENSQPLSMRIFSLHEIKTWNSYDDIVSQVRALFSKERYQDNPNEFLVNLLVILDKTGKDEKISLIYRSEIIKSMQSFYSELEDKGTFVKKMVKLVDYPQALPLIRDLLLWENYTYDAKFWETFFDELFSKEKDLFFDFFTTLLEYETTDSFHKKFYPYVSSRMIEKALSRWIPIKTADSMSDLCAFAQSLREEKHYCLLKKWSEHTSPLSAEAFIIHLIQTVCANEELKIHVYHLLNGERQVTEIDEQKLLDFVLEMRDLFL